VVFDDHAAWRVPVLSAFLVVLPTLLPGFLYLRFITFRIGPLRDEYVYNLHRLGVDSPEHLREPPRCSKDLCLVVLAVGWASVVWTVPVADTLPRLADALRFGFLGAYFFLLLLLVRRYFQNDLRPGTYRASRSSIQNKSTIVFALPSQSLTLQSRIDGPGTADSRSAVL
jgi:hypothetical protein